MPSISCAYLISLTLNVISAYVIKHLSILFSTIVILYLLSPGMAKVQAQLEEIISILKVDVAGMKEQLDSLSVQVAGLRQGESSSNGETEDSLTFESEFQFPVRSFQDLKRVEEKLSSSLPFRKYLVRC